MGDNAEVMDLWARYSIEGLSKISAEELLMKDYEQV